MRKRLRLAERRRFEELLDGGCRDDSALSRTLSAARAPGTHDELTGLPAARAAYIVQATSPHRRPRAGTIAAATSAASRFLALKVIAGVSGATLLGGMAYAATGTTLLGGSPGEEKKQNSPPARSASVHRGGGGSYGVGPGRAGTGARPTDLPSLGPSSLPSQAAVDGAPPTELPDPAQSNPSTEHPEPGEHTPHPEPSHTPEPGETHSQGPGSTHTPELRPSHTPQPSHTPTKPRPTHPRPTPSEEDRESGSPRR